MAEIKEPIQKKRNLNLDLIRCVAVISVIARHFFLNTGYDDRVISGGAMYIMTFLRTLTMVCVPLFVMLTGYLCSHKELKRGYFLKILPVLTTYFLCSVFTLLWRKVMWKEEVSLLWGMAQILKINEGAVWYGWYIEMYIGLYLLIPFLNLIYKGLVTKQKKIVLLMAMLIMTMLPISVNIYDFSTADFWRNPSTSTLYYELLPSWWTGMWPVTYYFIGAYIREYHREFPKVRSGILLLTCLLVFTLYNIYRSQGTSLFRPNLDNWGGFQNTVDSVLLFIVLLKTDLSQMPKWISRVVHNIAQLSLGIYLCSYISDMEVYSRFNSLQMGLYAQIAWYPMVVLASFMFAWIVAEVISIIQKILIKVAKQYVDPLFINLYKRYCK